MIVVRRDIISSMVLSNSNILYGCLTCNFIIQYFCAQTRSRFWPSARHTHTHINIYIYIYIYVLYALRPTARRQRFLGFMDQIGKPIYFEMTFISVFL